MAKKRKDQAKMPLSTSDEVLLDEFEKRCVAVQELVHHVITNEDTYCMYLWGPRGCGKTSGIERALAKLGVSPVVFRGSMTAQALFTSARDASDAVLWINDDPTLLREPAAQQYLIAMLEPIVHPKTGRSSRVVTKSRVKAEDNQSFEFTGKIIFDSNVSVVNSRSRQTLEAVKDRMRTHHFGPKDAELAAVMRYLAEQDGHGAARQYIRLNDKDRKYWQQTTPAERTTIVEFICDQAKKYQANLSLRMLRDTVIYYVSQKQHDYSTDWRDNFVKELTQYDVEYQYSKPPSRKTKRLEDERRLLREMLEDDEECMKEGRVTYKHDLIDLWCKFSGQGERQFRRRLDELDESYRAIYDRMSDRRMREETVKLSER